MEAFKLASKKCMPRKKERREKKLAGEKERERERERRLLLFFARISRVQKSLPLSPSPPAPPPLLQPQNT